MTFDDVRRLTGVVAIPLVVVTLDGEVVAVNRAARALCDGLVVGCRLTDVLDDEPGDIARRLVRWSRQGTAVPARLTFRGGRGGDPARAEVARLQVGQTPALLFAFRGHDHDSFARLNDQLERLRGEVRYRRAVEEERARALEAEQATRQQLERLQTLTAALAAALSTDDVIEAILRFGPAAVGADGVVVRLTGRPRVERLSPGLPDHVTGFVRAGAAGDGASPLAAAARAAVPEFFGGVTALRAAYAASTGAVTRVDAPYLAGVVPLRSAGSGASLGALGIVCAHDSELNLGGRVTSGIVASLCSQALERARLHDQERRFAETLQRALLPGRLPDVAGIEFAVRYMPASETLAVGGDWYDVIALDGDRLGLVVGDVAGHGPSAATAMAQVSGALRALATTAQEPAEALTALNAYLCAQLPDEMATVVFVVVDRRAGSVHYANAGHLPPLLLGGKAGPVYLRGGLGPPVGVEPRTSYVTTSMPLGGCASVVAYTDGLVERRGEGIDLGLRRLERAVSGAPPDGCRQAEHLCDQVVDRLVGEEALKDDAVIVVARLLDEPATGERPGDATADARAVTLQPTTGTPAASTG